MGGRRRYRRQTGSRAYRRIFLIATEGRITEKIYFARVDKITDDAIRVACLKSQKNQSNPDKVLNELKRKLKEIELKKNDEAWVVIDRDAWTDEHLQRLQNWEKQQANYHLAISNPKFELWLLLHFEDGRADDCESRLKYHLPGYNKTFNPDSITLELIHEAIDRARQKDVSAQHYSGWPPPGVTTVYKLLKSILCSSGGASHPPTTGK